MALPYSRTASPASALCASLLLALGSAGAAHAQEAESAQSKPAEEISFSADQLDYEFATDSVKATGNVIARRDGYTLRADTIVWDRRTGKVTASGNIRSVGPEGDVAYGDSIEVTESLRDGIVENMLLVLKDGSRLAANRGTRVDGRMTLEGAAYTPCAVERPDGCPKDPSWQVKAVRVVYDPVKKRVKYDGARIELFGLPVIPLPGLSHPAETAAGSGFLVPNLRFSRNNGVEIEQGYYWRLSDNRDLLLSGHIFSDVAPMAQARYRAWEDKGAFQITGYATYSNKVSTSGTGAIGKDVFRGYIDGAGKFQFTPNWSASASVRLATDRTFLRRYDISRDDRLRNNINVERIDANSYFAFNGWGVQTLRTGDRQALQPIALPEIDYRLRLTDPVLGGRVQLQANSLLIGRTSGQDTRRAFASGRWDLRTLTGLGQEVNFTLLGRGDVYHSDENLTTVTPIYRGESGWKGRGIAAAAIDMRWPFAGEAFGGTQVVTPRIQLVGAYTSSNLKMPNEDARAVDLEDSNLFALNRFPGYDRIEDNVRITYGLDWSVKGKETSFDFNIGQSYRLSNRATIFPDGTGLSNKVSDIVGRSEIRFRDFVKFAHRFRLDKDNLAIRRNEVDATVGSRSTYVQVGYLRLNRNIGATTEDLADREEVRLAGRLRLARYWSLFGSTIIDLTDKKEDPLNVSDGLEAIRHRLGLAYDDDCLSIAVTWRRDYQPTGDARRGNTFLFRLEFKNLGV
ncbi:LPS-assembly protein LptD [Sphingorhabdus sp.]|jgi:LPS-assembly protein|uniref:LPS-assembly protein LptD n=1 Tax=Sphingorhabdus sp. TaxID=1902408 RepID=UPI0035AFC9E8|nr:LPS-assembly protein LptD [Sphingomonadaceae bacterium]